MTELNSLKHSYDKYAVYYIERENKPPKIGACWAAHVAWRAASQNATLTRVLEICDDIYEVSRREIELQKEYGLKVDKVPYWKIIKNFMKNRKLTNEQECELVARIDAGECRSKVCREYNISGTTAGRIYRRYKA